MEKDNILTVIQNEYEFLTSKQKRIADYVLNHPRESANLSISAMSERTQTSAATISRFTIRVGCAGYADFQNMIYEEETNTVAFSSLKNRLKTMDGESQENPLLMGIKNSIGLLESLYTPNMIEALNRTADTIWGARHVYIIGMGSSYAVAFYIGFMLRRMRTDVIILDRMDSGLSSCLADLNQEDCLIAVAYSRYTKITCKLLSYYKKQNVPIVVITDAYSSQVSRLAREILVAPRDDYFTPTSAMVLCSVIFELLRRKDAAKMLDSMERQDRIAVELDLYQ